MGERPLLDTSGHQELSLKTAGWSSGVIPPKIVLSGESAEIRLLNFLAFVPSVKLRIAVVLVAVLSGSFGHIQSHCLFTHAYFHLSIYGRFGKTSDAPEDRAFWPGET